MKTSTQPKKVIIIGAGISGLTSGIYGQKNGLITEIYEKNATPGGLCTSWQRKSFPIDGCIHWMTGTKKGTAIYNMWQDVGAFNDEDIIRADNFGTVEIDGVKITLWNDLNKLEEELIRVAPEDKRRIKRLCDRIFLFQNMPLPVDMPVNTMKLKDFIKIGFGMIPYLFSYIRCSNISMTDYFKKFKNRYVREALSRIIDGDYSLYSALYVYGTSACGNGGVPRNGSTSIINNMVNRYSELGGKLYCAKEIKSIIIKNGKAVGVKFVNGEEKYADYVIAACDPFHAISLLGENYSIPEYVKCANNPKKYPLPSCVLVSYAVDENVKKALNLTSTYQFLVKDFKVGNSEISSLKIRDYSYDKHFVKNGKVLMNVLIPQFDNDYPYWEKIKGTKQYYEIKNQIAEKVSNYLIEKFPTLKGKMELLDVATPNTFNRYTHAFRGAYMPFALTAKNHMMLHNGKIKGVKNFSLSSQWQIMPGGLPVALMSGKFAIQRILKKEKLNYKITKHVKFSYSK